MASFFEQRTQDLLKRFAGEIGDRGDRYTLMIGYLVGQVNPKHLEAVDPEVKQALTEAWQTYRRLANERRRLGP